MWPVELGYSLIGPQIFIRPNMAAFAGGDVPGRTAGSRPTGHLDVPSVLERMELAFSPSVYWTRWMEAFPSLEVWLC